MSRAITFALCALILLGAAGQAAAQLRLERIQLRSGGLTVGEVKEVRDDALVVVRRVGRGSIRESIRFERISPNSLYAVLVSVLSPLDAKGHRRIADVAFEAGLFATAARHYRSAAGEGETLPPNLAERVRASVDADITFLLERSRRELDDERFSRARRLAMLAMRRYAGEDAVAGIPDYLEAIRQRYAEAKRRDAALERTKRARRAWERGEELIGGLQAQLARAKRFEVRALNITDHFKQSKLALDTGVRYLRSAEKTALKLRQSKEIPAGLRPRLRGLEDEVISLNIRLRLHVASLYTVRGSYGAALAYVNSALAYDPSDEQALAARARIEQAAAASPRRYYRPR